MEKLDQILQLVLQGQKGPEILLPKVDEHTGETDISELVDQLKQRGIPEEEVDDTVVRDYIEEHREEVSTYVTALSQRVRKIHSLRLHGKF